MLLLSGSDATPVYDFAFTYQDGRIERFKAGEIISITDRDERPIRYVFGKWRRIPWVFLFLFRLPSS